MNALSRLALCSIFSKLLIPFIQSRQLGSFVQMESLLHTSSACFDQKQGIELLQKESSGIIAGAIFFIVSIQEYLSNI